MLFLFVFTRFLALDQAGGGTTPELVASDQQEQTKPTETFKQIYEKHQTRRKANNTNKNMYFVIFYFLFC